MPRTVSLLLYVAITSLGDALAPTRRAALRSAVGALSLTTAQRADAATNAEAEKVRVASRELNELLKNEDALRFKVGDKVSCNAASGWSEGTIVAVMYRTPDMPSGFVAPYQIQLDDGPLIYAPMDDDRVIKAAS